ncbi:MAG: DDE-type integrase/transposase/recombinase [Cyanobacteria bacterium P01_D01_bin.116]
MLSTSEFETWCRQLNLNDYTQELITQIRASKPERAVQGGRSNVCGTYPSQKMGVTIQFESHRGELAHIIDYLEHNKEVLEYYDQPPAIELVYKGKNNNLIRCRHTPDFFVIKTDGAFWEEFKTTEELIKQSKEKPGRYIHSDSLSFRCPPGENYASKYGLQYHVCSNADINPIRLRNWIWLEPYFQAKEKPVKETSKIAIVSYVQHNPGVTIADLLQFNEDINPDDINYLIATEQIYINFDKAPLAEPDKVEVFSSQELAIVYQRNLVINSLEEENLSFSTLNLDTGNSIIWDNEYWQILNVGSSKVYLTNSDNKIISIALDEFRQLFETGHVSGLENSEQIVYNSDGIQKILSHARPKDIQIANQRYEAIRPYLEDKLEPITKASRTLRRWRDNYYKAQQVYGKENGYLGLLPRHLDKGHHEKIDPCIVAFMDEFIEEHYFSPKNRRISAVYRDFKQACKNHEPPFLAPSEKRFRLQIKRKSSSYKRLCARSGSRVAKQSKPWNATKGLPRHGELPWESAHIDHTVVDIQLVSSLLSLATCNTSSALTQSDINLGRCWATVMVDSYSKRILAVYLSFEEPSHRSCMMVIRICVQRWLRLPQTIITDNGKEFHSIYFKQLLAYYRCTQKYRPPGEPRYGNPVERIFGTTNTLWIHELRGNTQIQKQHRQVTKSVNPKKQAVWTLGELYQSLEYWAYTIYDKREHSTLGQSPQQAYQTGIALGGQRVMRRIEYNNTFLILTLPSPSQGTTRIVQPGRGVKISNIWYWCDAFRDPEIEKTAVSVKEDPFNASIAYAYVLRNWHQCLSDHYSYLEGRTEKELKIISTDLRKRKLGHAKRVEISDTELIEYLHSAQVMEGELLQKRLQALENRTVIDLIEGEIPAFNSPKKVTLSHEKLSSEEDINNDKILAECNKEELEFYSDF